MKIYFIGTNRYSKALLERTIDLGYTVVGVGTKHDTGFNADYADLGVVAAKQNIPCHFTSDVNAPEHVQRVCDLAPDVVFCFGWNRLLKEPLLSLPRFGCIGHHPAALPKNRGRHPLIWAIALGLESSASTFFYLDPGIDNGDIISQDFTRVFPDQVRRLGCYRL